MLFTLAITRIASYRSTSNERYWSLWSESRGTVDVYVFVEDLAMEPWLDKEALGLRDLLAEVPDGQTKILETPVIIEVLQDGDYYQVARVVKGPPLVEVLPQPTATGQDWIAAIASQIQARVMEFQAMMQAQQARIAELEDELTDKQSQIDELTATIQAQQVGFTLMENEADQAEAANLSSVSLLESALSIAEPARTEDHESGAAIFYPITDASPREDDNDLPIPPRRPADKPSEIRTERLMHPDGTHVLCYEANMDLTPKPEYIEVMLAFIETCEEGQYLNYSQADFSSAQMMHTSKLFWEGMLECSMAASYKLRPSAAGEIWYHQHTASQTEVSEPKIAIDSSKVEQIRRESQETRDNLLSEADADSEQSDPAQENDFLDEEVDEEAVVDIPAELTDYAELVSIIGAGQSDTARLMAVMMKNDWECALDDLEAAFKGEFVNVMMDDINERAYEALGDSLIVEEAGQWVIDEGYHEAIEYILNHPDYRGQIGDNPLKEDPLEIPLSADPWAAFVGQLQNYQREALAAISSGRYVLSSLHAIAVREYISVYDIIHQIDELAAEHLGNSLIEDDGFLTPTIVKESQQKLKYVLWGISREMKEDENDQENT